MDAALLSYFRKVTEEEQTILDGSQNIDRDLYMQGKANTIHAQKLLTAGKLITIRPHTRFIHFPEYTYYYENLTEIRRIYPKQSVQFLFKEFPNDFIERLVADNIDVDAYYKSLTKENFATNILE